MVSPTTRYFSDFSSQKQNLTPPYETLKLTRVLGLANQLRDTLGIPKAWVEAHYEENSKRFPYIDRRRSPFAELNYCEAILQAWVHGGIKKVPPDKRRQRTPEEWKTVNCFFDDEFAIEETEHVNTLRGHGSSEFQNVIRAGTNVNIYAADQKDDATHSYDIVWLLLCVEELIGTPFPWRQKGYITAQNHDLDEITPIKEPTGRVAATRFGTENGQTPVKLHHSFGWQYLFYLADKLGLNDPSVAEYILKKVKPAMKSMDDWEHTRSNLREIFSRWGVEGFEGFVQQIEKELNVSLKDIKDTPVLETEEGFIASLIKFLDRAVGSLDQLNTQITGPHFPATKNINRMDWEAGLKFILWADGQKKYNTRHRGKFLYAFLMEAMHQNLLPDSHPDLPNEISLRPSTKGVPKQYETTPAATAAYWGALEGNDPEGNDIESALNNWNMPAEQKTALLTVLKNLHKSISKRKIYCDTSLRGHGQSLGAVGRVLDQAGTQLGPALQAAGGIAIAANYLGVSGPFTQDLCFQIPAVGSLLSIWPMFQVSARNRLPWACAATAVNTAVLGVMATHGAQASTDLLPWLIGGNVAWGLSYFGNRMGRPYDNRTKMEWGPSAVPRYVGNLLSEAPRLLFKKTFKSIIKSPQDVPETIEDFRVVAGRGSLERGVVEETVSAFQRIARMNFLTQAAMIPFLVCPDSLEIPQLVAAGLFSAASIGSGVMRYVDGADKGNVWWQISGGLGAVAFTAQAAAEVSDTQWVRALGITLMYLSFASFSKGLGDE
jgi:hypothetical protein